MAPTGKNFTPMSPLVQLERPRCEGANSTARSGPRGAALRVQQVVRGAGTCCDPLDSILPGMSAREGPPGRSPEEVSVRIAVTGATGVLGQEAEEALVAAGHEVTGITRRDSGVPIIEGRGGSAIVADVFDPSDLTRAFRG